MTNRFLISGLAGSLMLLWGCFFQSGDSVEYSYTIVLDNKLQTVTIDSIHVTVMAGNKNIMQQTYDKSSFEKGTLTFTIKARESDRIRVTYDVYSMDVLMLEHTDEFTIWEAAEEPDKSSTVEVDSMLIFRVIGLDSMPDFLTSADELSDTLTVGEEYKKLLQVKSATENDITLEILEGWQGLTLKNNLLSGTVSREDLGTYTVSVELRDGQDRPVDTLTWEIVVVDINHAPVFITTTKDVLTSVIVNTVYRDTVEAEDPDDDSLDYELLEFPGDMQLASNVIEWHPDQNDIGNHQISLEITDGRGFFDSLTWNIEVVDTNTPPIITQHPRSDTVTAGETAHLLCGAIGKQIVFKWQVDGIDISGAQGTEYQTQALDLDDDSTAYRCIVTNNWGSDTSDLALISMIPVIPEITLEPGDALVNEGAAVVFTIEASGVNLKYQWYAGGTSLPGATEPEYSLPSATPADTGIKYFCVVTNGGGSDTSHSVQIAFNLVAPAITLEPGDLTVVEGEPAQFLVEASGIQMKYQWQKEQTNLTGATSPVYTIQQTDMEDNGSSYRCIISNPAGNDTSNTALLQVTPGPPVLTQQPVNLTLTEGQTGQFSVSASGHEVTYQWLKNGEVINGAASATLIIASAVNEDNGAGYSCRVSNAGGQAVSEAAVLTVTPLPPVITLQPRNVTVAPGEAFEFSVTAQGFATTYQWYKNDVEIPGANKNIFSGSSAVPADNASEYFCVVGNGGGSVTSSTASLHVTSLLQITSHPQPQTVSEGETAVFTLTASGNNLTYQWQLNGTDITGAVNSGYTTTTLGPGNSGDIYRCIVGDGTTSDTSNPAAVTVIAGNTFMDSRDNSIYKTVTIGSQTWMGENLNYVPQQGQSWCYNNQQTNCEIYGRLYDWQTATAGTHGNGVDVCPEGWHLPSDTEWDILKNFLASQGHGSNEGSALKSTSGWNSNGNGIDVYGFDALPGGHRINSAEYFGFGSETDFWSSSDFNPSQAYVHSLSSSGNEIIRTRLRKDNGHSVRCVSN